MLDYVTLQMTKAINSHVNSSSCSKAK